MTAKTRASLHVLGTLLHGHLRSLVTNHGFALPPAGLTGREIACLRLVAQGLSDSAIGAALRIAPSTAHEFVEKAKARLRVRSRTKLVAIAVELGIISA
ncbi:response regulator transcription factor [Sphingomonas bacterium]|uniref:response regulator transcription factor n=1 Tax=Sphingomonas bacterium TaxID=1895847 RepID=UPI0034A009EF